ncbi:hypothetical protein F503_02568 [Ophiostoma piceae UAMH 11346]|uniref:Uncharacterized protein n=1 Tax=Ophiostoma piceae (strain UAMH 11346) TaxID=1262450 RepID=S3CZN0_OPHP1|nr:hypothetical protein F503_02568 [Ophiostoma piceae UAMH 11346]
MDIAHGILFLDTRRVPTRRISEAGAHVFTGAGCQLAPNNDLMTDTSISMVLNSSITIHSERDSTKPVLSFPDPRNCPSEVAMSNGITCEIETTDTGTWAQAHAVAYARGCDGQYSQLPIPAGEFDYDDNDKSTVHAPVGDDNGPTLMPDGWLAMKGRSDGIMAAIAVVDSFSNMSSTRCGNEGGQAIGF